MGYGSVIGSQTKHYQAIKCFMNFANQEFFLLSWVCKMIYVHILYSMYKTGQQSKESYISVYSGVATVTNIP